MAGLKSEGLAENMGFCAILTLGALSYQHLQLHTSFTCSYICIKPASGEVLQQTMEQMFDVMTSDLMRSTPARVKQNNKQELIQQIQTAISPFNPVHISL